MKNTLTQIEEGKPAYSGLPNLNSINPATPSTYTTPGKTVNQPNRETGGTVGAYDVRGSRKEEKPAYVPDQNANMNTDPAYKAALQGKTVSPTLSPSGFKAQTGVDSQKVADATKAVTKAVDAPSGKKGDGLRESAQDAVKKAEASGFDVNMLIGLLESFGAGYTGRKSRYIELQDEKKSNKRQDELMKKEQELQKQQQASAAAADLSLFKEKANYEASLNAGKNFGMAGINPLHQAALQTVGGK